VCVGKEIKKETDWLGNEKEVIYEDNEKVGEIRNETTFWGTEVKREYNPEGERVSETRHEHTVFGTPVDRTYNPDGERISETRHEHTIFGTPVDRTYDTDKDLLSETKRETTFWGTPVKRVYGKQPSAAPPRPTSSGTDSSDVYGGAARAVRTSASAPLSTPFWASALGWIAGFVFAIIADSSAEYVLPATLTQGLVPSWVHGCIAWWSVAIAILFGVTVTALLAGRAGRAGKAATFAIGLTVVFAILLGIPATPNVQQHPFRASSVGSATKLEGQIIGMFSPVNRVPPWLGVVLGQRSISPDNYPPPDGFQIRDRCAGEACGYQRRWRALRETPLFATWDQADAERVYTLADREMVTTLTGVWIVRKPAVLEVLEPISIGGVDLQRGDLIYVLMYVGEGFVRAAFHGKLAEFSPNAPNNRVVTRKLLNDYDVVPWVQMKTSMGVVGWTKEAGYPSFDGQSPSAGAIPDITPGTGREQNGFWDYDVEVNTDGKTASLKVGSEIIPCADSHDVQKVHTGFILRPDERQAIELVANDGGELLAKSFVEPAAAPDNGSEARLRFVPDRVLEGHTERVYSAPLSFDGRLLASASYDHTIKLWDVASGHELRTFAGHSDMVFFDSLSPDGRYLASASRDQSAKLWDARSGQEIYTFTGHQNWVHSVAFSPDGRYLATGSDDATIKLWDLATGRELRTLRGHNGSVMSVAFSPDGRYLASGGLDSSVKLWALNEFSAATHEWVITGRQIRTFRGHSNSVSSVIFSTDGQYLASASADRTARIWEVATGDQVRSLVTASQVNSVAFTPDDRYLAGACFDGTVRIWNVSGGNEIATLTGHTGRVFFVTFSTDGHLLASAGEDHTVRLWRRDPTKN